MNKRLNARSMYQGFEHDFGPFCAKVPPKLHFTVVIDFSRQRTKSDSDGWILGGYVTVEQPTGSSLIGMAEVWTNELHAELERKQGAYLCDWEP